ncbi:MAG: hypothetical protein U0R64_02390 [Candidatus Nanopelagicales bacterium]
MTEPTADIITWRTPGLVRLQAGSSATNAGSGTSESSDPLVGTGTQS